MQVSKKQSEIEIEESILRLCQAADAPLLWYFFSATDLKMLQFRGQFSRWQAEEVIALKQFLICSFRVNGFSDFAVLGRSLLFTLSTNRKELFRGGMVVTAFIAFFLYKMHLSKQSTEKLNTKVLCYFNYVIQCQIISVRHI